MQTATNPKTGEVAVLVENNWVKAERIATNDNGDKAYLVGGKWLTSTGKAELPPVEKSSSATGVATEIGKGLLRGASNTAAMIPEGIASALPGVGGLMREGVRRLSEPSRDLVKATPEGEGERFAGTAAEIVGAGAAGGGLGSVRNAVVTGASGIAGATGEQIGGEFGKGAGAILPAVIDVALTAGRNIPRNMVAKRVQQNADTPYAARGEDISQRTGIDLSMGQRTGDEATMLVEGMAAKNPFSAKEFQKFGAQQLGQSVTRLQKIMDDITPDKVPDVRLGAMVNQAFDDAVNGAANVRRSQAKVDFDAVSGAAGKDAKIVGTQRLRAQIDDLVGEFDVPGGGDASAALVQRLKNLKNGLDDGLTASQTERLLEVYTKTASGKGQLFQDLETAQQRLIAGRLKSSLLGDLDEAAQAQYGGAPRLLAVARDNYRANSQSLTKLEDSVLGKFLGADRSPERVADFVARAKPTELKQTLDLVNKTNPEIIPATRRHFIERALDDAQLPASKRNPSAPNFSAARFIDAMPEGAKFEVLFGSSNARAELKMVGEALQRIAYRGFTEGSPTAPLMMAWDATKKLFTIQGIVGLPAAVIAPRTIAKASLTPEGRRAIVTLSRYDKANESVVRAASYLATLAEKDKEQ